MKNDKKYISILSDYGFKITFADETDTIFLRKALQAIIDTDQPIKEVQFLNNEFKGITKDARGGLYDLICKDENGDSFIVEMQVGDYPNYIHRAKFYAFQRFNTLVAKGKYRFENLKKIYCIGFIVKSIFHFSEHFHHQITLRNQYNEQIDNQITHIIIEISKFDKDVEQIKTDLDKLIFIMANQELLEQIETLPKKLSEDWIEQAIQKLDKSRMTPEQRMHYEMMLAKNASILEMEKNEREAELAENTKNVMSRAVNKLIEKGIDINEISEITGLSKDEILEIIERK